MENEKHSEEINKKVRNIYTYSGYIKLDYKSLISFIKEVLDASKVRDRYAADIEKVIHYNDENLEIYINEDSYDGFIFSAEYKGTFIEANEFIDNFTKKLKERNIKHQFEWSEVDENDEQIGEEFEIKYP